MTGWQQYEKLNNKLIKHMKKKLVIDCRRILSNTELDAEYYAIGIGRN